MRDNLNDKRFPTKSEPALIHPDNKANIKLRDNGIIDIYSKNHQGIRIDPSTQTLNTTTNTQKEHLGSFRRWVTKDARQEVGIGYRLYSHNYIKTHSEKKTIISTHGTIYTKGGSLHSLHCGNIFTYSRFPTYHKSKSIILDEAVKDIFLRPESGEYYLPNSGGG